MDNADKQNVALWLLSKRENNDFITDAEQLPPITTISEVYDCHYEMTKIKSTLGVHVGWKCAACAPAVMKALGISEPFRAPLFSERVAASPGSTSVDEANGCLEAEFAFIIGEALPKKESAYTEDQVWAAVSHVCIAIEVCGTRYSGAAAKAANGLHKMVDGGANASCVYGQPVERSDVIKDLDSVVVTFKVNGESAATGSGANVLGHPVRSLTWLANHLADAGIATSDSQYGAGADTGLLPGDFVMSGAAAVLKSGNYKAGDRVVAEFGGMGQVEVVLLQEDERSKL